MTDKGALRIDCTISGENTDSRNRYLSWEVEQAAPIDYPAFRTQRRSLVALNVLSTMILAHSVSTSSPGMQCTEHRDNYLC